MRRGIIAALLATLGIAAVAVLVPWRESYALRVLVWNAVGIDDVAIFPAREIANAPPATHFQPAAVPLDAAALPAAVTRHFAAAGADGLDDFLVRTNTTAFVVLGDGALAYERYFNGHARDSVETSFSAAKSFVSAMVGIAIAEGRIKSLSDPVAAYLPELAEKDIGAVTIAELLSMRSGIPYAEDSLPWSDDAIAYYGVDLRGIARSRHLGEAPGTRWRYNDYNLILIGMVLERATGGTLASYLSEKIWRPLGMEFPASWSLDERGFEKTATGLNARAIDFAKFGQLYLQEGNWAGRQIVPRAFVAASTRFADGDPDILRHVAPVWKPDEIDLGYKYYWWVLHRPGRMDDFFASGNLGQYIFVSPANRVVIVRNGYDWGGFRGWPAFLGDLADAAGTPAPAP